MKGESYDVVVCGTGITESVLSGLLAMDGMKVLHVDRNSYYGDAGASLNLTALWNKFKPNEGVPKALGQNRDWNVDLIPKFVMAYGKLVKLLFKTQVSYYLRWRAVDGSYVYQWKEGGFFSKEGGKIEKVPSNDKEALGSDLMSLFEKRRCQKFFKYVQDFEMEDKKTHKKSSPVGKTFRQWIGDFSLEDNTIDFVGHSVALHTTEKFMDRPALETIDKVKLYMESVGRFGESPFIYPIYGLAGIPEGFSRKCAVHGGTFMLNQDINKINVEGGSVTSVEGMFEGEQTQTKTKYVIASPSYINNCGLESKLVKKGKIIRVICIMDHPIPKTKEKNSVQIIIPQKQSKRKNDIYVMQVSSFHNVCKKGYFIAIISTTVETSNPESELKLAYELIGPVLHKFTTFEDIYEPASNDFSDNVFITKTLDPTSHFETAAENVLEIYKKITGKDLDLENLPEDPTE